MTADLSRRLRSAAADAVRSTPDDDYVEALAAVAREAASALDPAIRMDTSEGVDAFVDRLMEPGRRAADAYLDMKLKSAAMRAVAAYEDKRRPGTSRWEQLDAISRLAGAMADLEKAVGR